MRLGETGLNIEDYLEAVEDEILRDNIGEIYYKSVDGNIISTGKESRTSAMVDYILDKFHVEDMNLEANIYIFPGHPTEINTGFSHSIKILKEELGNAKCVLFCDTISSTDKDEAITNTVGVERKVSLSINGNATSIPTCKMFSIDRFISDVSTQVYIKATQVTPCEDYKYEYLIGIYLLLLKEV